MNQVNFEALFAGPAIRDHHGRKQLFAALYEDLRLMAKQQLRRDRRQLTLSPTTLLHETYLVLTGREALTFAGRRQFMAYACRTMRGLVVDHIRSRCSYKRGGEYEITSLPNQIPEPNGGDDDLLRVSELVDELAGADPDLAELVEMRFFCGYSVAELAELRGVNERTVRRQWDKARIFLFEQMRRDAARPAK